MLTVLATLPFLAALAVAVLAIVSCLSADGRKVLLALRGESPLAHAALATRPVTVRFSPRSVPLRRQVSVVPQLRVAA